MKFFEDLCTVEFWRQLTENDFERGYLTGVGLALLLLLALLVLRLILKLMFRNRRSGVVVVSRADGDLVISRDAVESSARHVLNAFPQLDVRRIQLYRKGKRYSMTLICGYSAGEAGIPELAEKLKPMLLEKFRTMFGIEHLSAIRIRVEELVSEDEESPEEKPVVNVVPGF